MELRLLISWLWVGLSSWAKCNHKGPYSKLKREAEGECQSDAVWKSQPVTARFEAGETEPQATECGYHPEARKLKEQIQGNRFSRAPKENEVLPTPWSSGHFGILTPRSVIWQICFVLKH